MKTIILLTGLFMTNLSMACSDPSIKSELASKINLDLSAFEFDELHENFVVFRFKIHQQQIKVLDMMGSNQELIKLMESELNSLQLDKDYPTDETYSFKFIFTKH